MNNFDVLDIMKSYSYISTNDVFTVQQTANIYGVTPKAVKTIIERNMNEFLEDGIQTINAEEFAEFVKNKGLSNDLLNEEYTLLIPSRAFKRIGCFLGASGIGTFTRNYLLNLEETATIEQKSWAIQREVGIIERKRMASAICKYLPESKNKKFAYPNYTNMIYKILFAKTAKEMRDEKGLSTNDALRDTFTTEQLKLVEESETIVTALVALGFTYNQIKEQLERKYMPMIE